MKGKRGPLIAGAVSVLVAILMVMLLVLPKMGTVTEARDELSTVQSEQQTLLSRKKALEDAKDRAPENRAAIAEVERQIPPVADQPGLILLLQNAARSAGIDIVSLSPSPPAFDATTGLSMIQVDVSASGTYFDVTEFMYRIETLPRAAKVTAMTVGPESTEGVGVPRLTLAASIQLFTSDASAGPGSVPGPTSPTGGA